MLCILGKKKLFFFVFSVYLSHKIKLNSFFKNFGLGIGVPDAPRESPG